MGIIDNLSEKAKDAKNSAIDSKAGACHIPDSFTEKAKDFTDDKIDDAAQAIEEKLDKKNEEDSCCGSHCACGN